MAGRKVAVTAEQLHGSDRAEPWRQITTAAPRFAGYESKTDRELPVIRLVAQRRFGPHAAAAIRSIVARGTVYMPFSAS